MNTKLFLAFEVCFSDVFLVSYAYTRDMSLKHTMKNAKKKLHIHLTILIPFQLKKCMLNFYFILFLSINKSYLSYPAKNEYKANQNANFLYPYITKQSFYFYIYYILWKMTIKYYLYIFSVLFILDKSYKKEGFVL